MYVVRLFVLFGVLCLAIIANNLPGNAVDIKNSPEGSIQEATLFFRTLMQNNKNPVIAEMARDSLKKLEIENPSPYKKVTEVTLLPQHDSTYVVPAIINDKYVSTFLIDTGASYTVVTPKMIEYMHIKIPKNVDKIPVSTANGVVFAPIIQLNHVTIGGMTVSHVDAVITELGDEMHISGLLGMNYFKGMDLSFRQNKLVLSR